MHIAVIRAGAMPELSMVATFVMPPDLLKCSAKLPDVLHQYRIYLMIDKTVYF